MNRSWHISLFLLVVLVGLAVGDVSVFKRAADAALSQAATRSDDPQDLPTLDALFDNPPDNGAQLSYEGCDIFVEKAVGTVALDLKAESCKDIMSVPRIFKKLTNQDLDMWKRFTPMKKFNVDVIKLDLNSKDVSIEASAKETFCFLRGTKMKVKEGELGMDFNFDEEFKFEDINIDVGGRIGIGDESAVFSLSKEKKAKEGTIDIQMPSLPIANFVLQLVKLKTPPYGDMAMSVLFKTLRLDNPQFTGYKSEDGITEVAITGSAVEIPLIGPAELHLIIKSEAGKPAEFCLTAKLTATKPGELIGKLLKNKKGLDKVPMINDLSLDLVLQYSTAELGAPTDQAVLDIMNEFTSTPYIKKGLTVSFVLPFHSLLEKVSTGGSMGQANEQFDITVMANVNECGISFDFGDSEIVLRNLLLAFVPNFNIESYDKIFGEVKIMVEEFQFDYKTKIVNLAFNATDIISINDGFLKVDDVKFRLSRGKEGDWTFKMESSISIGDGQLDISLEKFEDKYTLAGSIDSLRINDMLGFFKLTDGFIGKLVNNIKALQIEIVDVNVKAEYSTGGDTDFRLTGRVDFYGYRATFEGYLTKSSGEDGDTSVDFAFGIVVQDVCLGNLAKELLSSGDNAVGFPKTEWLSGITVSLIAGRGEDGLSFECATIQDALERISDGENSGGVFLDALAVLPDDCKGESICSFLKDKLGAGATLGLSGAITSSGFKLAAVLKGDLKLSEKFTLKEVSLNVNIGKGDAEFYIEGMCEVDFETSTQQFRASVSMSATGTFALSFSVNGPTWEEAFGLKYLSIKGFEMKAGINIVALAPTFTMAGELMFGTGANQITAQLAGGFESSPTTPGFYVYAKFNKLSIGSILNAFEVDIELPEPLKDTGFPNGLVAGMSLPGSKYIEQFDTTVKAGFALKGKFVFLGLGMFCDIEMDLPSSFKLEARFDPIRIGGGALELTGSGGSDGPYLLIEMGVDKFKISIDAHVQVLKIGVGAKITLDDEGFYFLITGQIGGLFEASLEVKAPYGKLGDMGSNEWMIKTCLGDTVMDKVRVGAVDEVQDAVNTTSHLEKQNDAVNQEANSWFGKVMGKMNGYKMDLLKLEEKFQKEVKDLEKSKSELNKDCAANCAKERTWVGGFGIKMCKLGSRQVECPYWISKKTLRESPYCLSKCENSKWWHFRWVVGAWNSGRLWALEKEMQAKLWVLDKVTDLLTDSKSLIDFAEVAAKKVGELGEMIAEAAAAIKKWAVEHLFYLKKACLTANLGTASKGLCFIVDADFYIGGKNGKHIVLENKEICLTRQFAMQIGAEIAREAFSGLRGLKEKAKGVTNFFSKSNDKAKAVEEAAAAADKRDECMEDPSKKCIPELKKLTHYRSDKYMSIPDIIVKNHKSMVAFSEIFDMDNDDISMPDPESSTKDEIEDFDEKFRYALNINPASLQNSQDSHQCERTREILDLYSGVVDTINYMEDKNTKAKEGYEAFIHKHQKKIKHLEKEALKNTEGLSEKDAEKAMFYVEKAKKGIASWKAHFDAEYAMLDQRTMKSWRGYMSAEIQEKGMDVASFVNMLDIASSESAQRAEIPSGGVQQSMAAVQQIVRGLLNTDDVTLSSKSSDIKSLNAQVKWLNQAKTTMSCFKDDEN